MTETPDAPIRVLLTLPTVTGQAVSVYMQESELRILSKVAQDSAATALAYQPLHKNEITLQFTLGGPPHPPIQFGSKGKVLAQPDRPIIYGETHIYHLTLEAIRNAPIRRETKDAIHAALAETLWERPMHLIAGR